MAFVHLHNHTEHSLCEGVMSVDDMVRRAVELDMRAIAVTDRGTMAGAVELRDACAAAEIETGRRVKPIYGCCVHLDPGDGLKKVGSDKLCQLTLLARTNAGYENLLRLVTESNESAVSSRCKPHVTLDMLRRYGEGLIGLSGGASSVVAMAVLAGKSDEAREWAFKLASCFGQGDFYIELQDQGLFLEGGMTQAELNRCLSGLALECGLATAATNDAHYLRRSDAELHLLMRCVKRSTRLSRKVRDRFPSNQFFLKDEREMREAFAAFPEACDSTVEIAEKCNVVLRDDLALPELPVPEGETAESLFCRLCEKGLVERYGGDMAGTYAELRASFPSVAERYEAEAESVVANGYCNYFLVVAEYVSWAREKGICVGPGRGPMTASVVAYALGITGVDPLAHGLSSSRALFGDGGAKAPDIDVDFEWKRRAEVIDHLKELYGEECVAGISACRRLSTKRAVREAVIALGRPVDELSRIERLIGAGSNDTIDEALEGSAELMTAYRYESDVHDVVDAVRLIECRPFEWDVHACGIAMCREPLVKRTALRPGRLARIDLVATMLDAPGLEKVGIAKFDILGTFQLDALSEACRNVRRYRDLELWPDDVPYDDELAFSLLCGELPYGFDGLFTFEGVFYDSFFRRVQPRSFSDVTAAIALNRRGPIMAGITDRYACIAMGKEPETYRDEHLMPILGETRGMLIYQEQLTRIAEEVCGFTPDKSEELRASACGGQRDAMARFERDWIDGAMANGIGEEAACGMWDDAVEFAGHAFCKAHAVACAVLAMRCAYMKAHYPKEYMAAVMTFTWTAPKLMRLVDSCKRMGMSVLTPDVNLSDVSFTPEGDGIRVGLWWPLMADDGLAERIVCERGANGPFASPDDFASRIEMNSRDKRYYMGKLADAGAFDSTGFTRRQATEAVRGSCQESGAGEWNREERCERERKALGAYVTEHPIDPYRESVEAATKWRIRDLVDRSMGIRSGTFAGYISGLETYTPKHGPVEAGFTLEDGSGWIRCRVPEYERLSGVLVKGAVVKVEGGLECRDFDNAIIVHDAWKIDLQ